MDLKNIVMKTLLEGSRNSHLKLFAQAGKARVSMDALSYKAFPVVRTVTGKAIV